MKSFESATFSLVMNKVNADFKALRLEMLPTLLLIITKILPLVCLPKVVQNLEDYALFPNIFL